MRDRPRPSSSSLAPSATSASGRDRGGTKRLVAANGQLNVRRLGTSHSPWQDVYHLMLAMPWHSFLGMVALVYLGINALFALAYLAGGNAIENAEPGSFAHAFFFSVQTMASIGYGAMYPRTTYAHLLVTIEALVGLMALAIATGLMFARFARPTAKVLFSNVAVITPYNRIPTLMFRVANQRDNRILEASIEVTLIQDEVTPEGHRMRRFYHLPLVRSHSPIFALTWMVMHAIDTTSPLYGKTVEDLRAVNAELLVTLTGLDETFCQTIHARHGFILDEFLWQMQFVDILTRMPNGQLAIDYGKFHDIVPSWDTAD